MLDRVLRQPKGRLRKPSSDLPPGVYASPAPSVTRATGLGRRYLLLRACGMLRRALRVWLQIERLRQKEEKLAILDVFRQVSARVRIERNACYESVALKHVKIWVSSKSSTDEAPRHSVTPSCTSGLRKAQKEPAAMPNPKRLRELTPARPVENLGIAGVPALSALLLAPCQDHARLECDLPTATRPSNVARAQALARQASPSTAARSSGPWLP